jgi:GNAT superfamily N-acetyltransferase
VQISVTQEALPDFSGYATIPIAFMVREIARPRASAARPGRFDITFEKIDTPYQKDYDAVDGGPRSWAPRFDVSRWAVFVARAVGRRVGGAVGVFDAPDVEMLAGRRDVALLWDIRVAPDARGAGVGAALMDAVEAWARARGAAWLEVETQNINAPACRFYARHGCDLHAVNPGAYPELPNETQLLWYKRLSPATG